MYKIYFYIYLINLTCGLMSVESEDMSVEDSTAAQTLSDITYSTTDYIRSSSSSFDPAWQIAITVEFYFRYSLIAIGIFGTAANALVLYALVMYNAQEAKKRAINLLLINQNSLDLLSCVLLVVSTSMGVNKTYLEGALGYFLCTVFISEGASYSSLYGSVINLTMLTLERYLKVVHPFWSKKYLKRWMIHVAMVFAWISGISFNMPVVFATTLLQDGVCLSYFAWENPAVRMMYVVIIFVCCFLVPLVVFVYCYGHIVVVMRRQMKVMAGHGGGNVQANAAQIQSQRIKWNIIKTMIIVNVTFVVCFSPTIVYFMIVDNTTYPSTSLYVGYSATTFLAYLNVCMNPFIYATKHDGVKQRLLSICYRCKGQAAVVGN